MAPKAVNVVEARRPEPSLSRPWAAPTVRGASSACDRSDGLCRRGPWPRKRLMQGTASTGTNAVAYGNENAIENGPSSRKECHSKREKEAMSACCVGPTPLPFTATRTRSKMARQAAKSAIQREKRERCQRVAWVRPHYLSVLRGSDPTTYYLPVGAFAAMGRSYKVVAHGESGECREAPRPKRCSCSLRPRLASAPQYVSRCNRPSRPQASASDSQARPAPLAMSHSAASTPSSMLFSPQT
jgi:hypothetical protein